MALTVSVDLVNANVVGNKRNHPVTITFDASYDIAGEAITAAQCGLVVLERLIFEGPAVLVDTPDFSVIPHFDKTNSKVQAFWADDAAPLDEVPDTTDLTGYAVRAIAVGY